MGNFDHIPLVSIALCTYNGEVYLKEQLDSLVHQTYPNQEILVFDDGSSDGTMGILKQYASDYPIIKVFRNEKNLGYVKNFEKAVRSCKGEFIALSDQDDIWDLNKIQLQVEAMNGHLLVYHDSELITNKGKSYNKKLGDIINLYHGDRPEVFLLFNCVSGHSCLISKRLLDYSLPFTKGYYHDHWLAYVAANMGTIGFVNQSLVKYRQHPDSNTDILRQRSKIKKGYHANRDVRKLKRDLKWLKLCAQFPYNKNPEFVHEFARLFEDRMNAFISLKYAWFLHKNKEILFLLQKRSVYSINTYIYKQIWGLRAKLLWGKFFDRSESLLQIIKVYLRK